MSFKKKNKPKVKSGQWHDNEKVDQNLIPQLLFYFILGKQHISRLIFLDMDVYYI